jgi:hypothetical protein
VITIADAVYDDIALLLVSLRHSCWHHTAHAVADADAVDDVYVYVGIV